MSHRTTSATPVSHVFPGRRGDFRCCRIGSCQRHQSCMYAPCRASSVRAENAHNAAGHPTYADQMEVVHQARSSDAGLLADLAAHQMAPRTPYKPAICQTPCRSHPDCVCAAYEALEGRQAVVDGLVRFTSDLVVYLGKLEARLRALEVSGEGERG